ncbi:MAG: type II toxin-antitoxin system RelE/ParE family toxin [Sulfurimonas sp.]
MAYNIEYDQKALKQLQKIDKSIASKILDGIEEFASEPVLTKIKKLKTPFDGAYRLRIGDYRVVFYQENNLMLISRIAHRKEVYI